MQVIQVLLESSENKMRSPFFLKKQQKTNKRKRNLVSHCNKYLQENKTLQCQSGHECLNKVSVKKMLTYMTDVHYTGIYYIYRASTMWVMHHEVNGHRSRSDLQTSTEEALTQLSNNNLFLFS